MPRPSGMEFLPQNFVRFAMVAALVAVPFVPGTAAGGSGPPPGKQAPVNTSPPSVSGSAAVGSSLAADPGSWTGPGIKLSYQWQRCDAFGNGCAGVADATSTSLVLAPSDVGYRFRVSVTGSNKNGSASAVSDPSGAVAPAPSAPPTTQAPAPTSSPEVAGTPVEGQTLSADSGTWSGTQPLAYRYQWQRCDSNGASCASVANATAQSYQLGANDVGAEMRVEVTASNVSGSATAVSVPTSPVTSSLGTSPSPSSPSGLTWAPPALSSPMTVQVQDSGLACPSITSPWQNPNQPWVCVLDPSKDYVLKLGNRRDPGGLEIYGGRNVVLIGGQITVPERTCCDRSDEWKSRALMIDGATGVVHVEGVLIANAADAVSIRAPRAIVQLENVRISNLHVYRDNANLAHPDIIQTFDGPAELRVDRLTADSDFTGLSLFKCCTSSQVFPGKVTLKNVNLSGNLQSNTVLKWPDGSTRTKPDLGYFTYMNYTTSVHSCQNCWVTTGWWSQSYQRKLYDSVGLIQADGSLLTSTPYRVTGYDGQVVNPPGANNDVGRRQGDYIEWPTLANLAGVRWYWGTPTGGDFVPTGLAGTGYTSPGYSG